MDGAVGGLHSALAQLEPIAQRHGLLDAAHVSSLITQHEDIQQKIDAAKARAAKLQLIADVERNSAQYDLWLAAGTSTTHLMVTHTGLLQLRLRRGKRKCACRHMQVLIQHIMHKLHKL